MKIYIIETLLVIALIVAFIMSPLQLNFAHYSYTDVSATLSDKDWEGGPYIVKEMSFRNRYFEEGDLSANHNKSELYENLLSHYPSFYTHLNTPENHYISLGDQMELCLDLVSENITQTSSSIYSSEYELRYDVDVRWESMDDHIYSIDDYEITFKGKVDVVGLLSEEYKLSKLREFVFFRIMDTIKEYNNQLGLIIPRDNTNISSR